MIDYIETKCFGRGCVQSDNCLRKTGRFEPDKKKAWLTIPHLEGGDNDQDCEFFISNAAWKPKQKTFEIQD